MMTESVHASSIRSIRSAACAAGGRGREVADEGRIPTNTSELEDVGRARLGHTPPQQPQRRAAPQPPPRPSRRSSAARGLRLWSRRFTGQLTERASTRRPGNREVGDAVDLLEVPVAGHDRDHEAGDVEQRNVIDLAPRERVADAPVERIGRSSVKRMMYGSGLDAGQARAGRRCRCRAPRRATAPSASRSRARTDRTSAGPGAMKNTKIQIGQWLNR